jgi:undecaprenyl diphosphate synthase
MINHIGWIMDGNRRYSKKNDISLKKGYKLGMEQFLNVLKFQIEENITHTSFFALSSDNYKKRAEYELKPIVDLIKEFFEDDKVIQFFIDNEFNITLRGNIEELEKKESFLKKQEKEFLSNLKYKFNEINEKVEKPTFFAHIALNYDGEEELIHSIKELIKQKVSVEEITAKKIKENLYFNDVKAPEIIVRPGNSPRLSGFLLFDSKYSEIYLTKKLWPELTKEDFKEIVNWYSNQKRNFGV